MAAYTINGKPLISFTWIGTGQLVDVTTNDIMWNISINNETSLNHQKWNVAPMDIKLEYISVLVDNDHTGNYLDDSFTMTITKKPTNQSSGSNETNTSFTLYADTKDGSSVRCTNVTNSNYTLSEGNVIAASYTGIGLNGHNTEHSFIFYFSQT
jgi:hypothetical protein